jgi:hypothetical protein
MTTIGAAASASVLAVAISAQVVSVREPTLPDQWVQTFEVRCGSDRLRIVGYGALLPYPGRGPEIASNGRPVRGEQAAGLRRDLSNRRAAYRLTGQCLPGGGGIWLRFYAGEMTYPIEGAEGRMRYQAGAATIRRGRIVDYQPLQPATERTYWFR